MAMRLEGPLPLAELNQFRLCHWRRRLFLAASKHSVTYIPNYICHMPRKYAIIYHALDQNAI